MAHCACCVPGDWAFVHQLLRVVGGVCVLFVVCAVSMARWRSFTACVMVNGGLPAFLVLCVVSMGIRRLFTAYAVLVGGVFLVCFVCAVSTGLWWLFTECATLVHDVLGLCVVCAVCRFFCACSPRVPRFRIRYVVLRCVCSLHGFLALVQH